MRRRRTRTPMAAIDQINVTPLLDLTFLLLIAFMITMPLMEYGTSINPPEMNSEKLPEENFISVTLTKDGTVMLDKEAVERLRTSVYEEKVIEYVLSKVETTEKTVSVEELYNFDEKAA